MSLIYSDTHPEMEDLQIRILRQMPPERKMALFCSLNAAARQVAWQGLKHRYPQASEAELRRHLADLLLGADLAQRVYGEWPYDG